MRIHIVSALLCIMLLSACAKPWPPAAFHPAAKDFYADLPEHYPLKGRITVGEGLNSFEKEGVITGPAYALAVRRIFDEAHLLSHVSQPPYRVDTDILDYRITDTGFFYVTAGAAVHYTLTDTARNVPVYDMTVTSTQKEHKALFQEAGPVMQQAIAVALGENAAQAVRQLAEVTTAQLHEAEPTPSPKKGKKK